MNLILSLVLALVGTALAQRGPFDGSSGMGDAPTTSAFDHTPTLCNANDLARGIDATGACVRAATDAAAVQSSTNPLQSGGAFANYVSMAILNSRVTGGAGTNASPYTGWDSTALSSYTAFGLFGPQDGTCKYFQVSNTWNVAYTGVRIYGYGCVLIKWNGASGGTVVSDDGGLPPAASPVQDQVFDGFTIIGSTDTSNKTGTCLKMQSASRGVFSHLHFINCLTMVDAGFSVEDHFNYDIGSTNVDSFAYTSSTGFLFHGYNNVSKCNGDTFLGDKIEGVTKAFDISFCDRVLVYGGTYEGGDYGIGFSSTTTDSTVTGTDFESNTYEDITSSGTRIAFYSITSSGSDNDIWTSQSAYNIVLGGNWGVMNNKTGAFGNKFISFNSQGGFTDSGSNTIIFEPRYNSDFQPSQFQSTATFKQPVYFPKFAGFGTGVTSRPQVPLEVRHASGGPAASGAYQTGLARLDNFDNQMTLDIGNYGTNGQGVWMQAARVNNLATNEALHLNPNGGNVGVNTTSTNLPATTLDVNGNAQFGSGATKSTFTAAGILQQPSAAGFQHGGGPLLYPVGWTQFNSSFTIAGSTWSGSASYSAFSTFTWTSNFFDQAGDCALVECMFQNGTGISVTPAYKIAYSGGSGQAMGTVTSITSANQFIKIEAHICLMTAPSSTSQVMYDAKVWSCPVGGTGCSSTASAGGGTNGLLVFNTSSLPNATCSAQITSGNTVDFVYMKVTKL